MKRIDLHVHSTASDGTLSPSSIIRMAETLDLAAVALTDHDTLDGIQEFLSAAKQAKVEAVPGVEIASTWNFKEIHILGLWIDHTNSELGELLKKVRGNREKRNDEMLNGLNKSGFDITLEEIKNEAGGEVIGRPHIASMLVKKKYFKTVKEVFGSCLARGAQNYVSRILPEIAEVISAIHNAGGIAIWAHPVHRNKSNCTNVKSDIIHFMSLGLDGIEAYYSEYSEKQHTMLLKYAAELNLQITGGTDFHGEILPGISMAAGRGNLSIPETVYTELKNYYLKQFKKL
jgi:predicted metal-dependent phosphoesterase TrpH